VPRDKKDFGKKWGDVLLRLNINAMREARGVSWDSLDSVTDVHWRTLQNYGLDRLEFDSIKPKAKKTLEQLARHWQVEYLDLFVEVADPEPMIAGLDELEDLPDIIREIEDYITEAGEDAYQPFMDFRDTAKQMKYLYTGKFDSYLNDFLTAEPNDFNKMRKNLIYEFVRLCVEQSRQDALKKVARNLINDSEQIRKKILCHFAIAMAKNKIEDSGKLANLLTGKLERIIGQ